MSLTAEDASSDEVELVDHDPSWSQQYAQMADWLRDQLGTDIALRVEHYGSTAIPGLPAKPVIDILVEIPSVTAAKPQVIPCFDDETWDYWWHAGHMVFVRREKLMGQRTHHIHMAPKGHPIWDGLAFRDHLRSHAEERDQYAELKRKLAVAYHHDRERYTQAKTDFVSAVTSRALRNS
ncbi:MAG: GrpB family protein [Gemmatimonadetes bacterium]|nr:GrpB family protein [Gemmatimonadota bacterium]